MSGRDQVLISATQLAELIAAGRPVSVLDVRWSLADTDGSAAYRAAHLPGAVFVSLEDELSDHSVAGRGRHPLPSGSAVQAAARRWGISDGAPVVVYDDWNRAGSSRAWWVLTAAGLPDVRILDGGLAAWRDAGGELESGAVQPAPGDVTVRHEDLYAGERSTLTAAQISAGVGTLLDARPPDRYRGDTEPLDASSGHIPGATNLPCMMLLADDGTFLDTATLTGLLADRGVADDAAASVYCGSGITATITVAALATLGQRAALFPGSWSEWSSDSSRPVARGTE